MPRAHLIKKADWESNGATAKAAWEIFPNAKLPSFPSRVPRDSDSTENKKVNAALITEEYLLYQLSQLHFHYWIAVAMMWGQIERSRINS